ncbi:hypothetical protein PUNSTDRAFT_120498 [Punctularia strigosozonata HHB-11173 SS5]|uniref:uncharacterized protein n=1 Tax=Punctularia strigosozonata (strain HHB-11173) TaxID=741275 RepID=UPI0004417BF1|nr:uncharacterized protein PUNSTDRAFT_120498 [Punctularia strigosozonata HHB-11173 SS5]EIN09048.1 hypothetical protein PUNSTDRAFT_120498 [Punctularia strigosozonata HHB-11173 SS5]
MPLLVIAIPTRGGVQRARCGMAPNDASSSSIPPLHALPGHRRVRVPHPPSPVRFLSGPWIASPGTATSASTVRPSSAHLTSPTSSRGARSSRRLRTSSPLPGSRPMAYPPGTGFLHSRMSSCVHSVSLSPNLCSLSRRGAPSFFFYRAYSG